MYVAVIGIDRYRVWGRLHNAVRDAEGARDAFVALGFKPIGPQLFDEAATGAALRRLVTDDLRALGTSDSLVLFFAGHGYTTTMTYPDGTLTKTGYLVPADGDVPEGSVGTWLNLDGWLREVAFLPPKHILVVLDACHSGVALNPVIRWRGSDVRLTDPLERLRARRSRRIITSALDDQLAMDSGPIHGHSLFTGCLIEALTGGIAAKTGQSVLTGSQIGVHHPSPTAPWVERAIRTASELVAFVPRHAIAVGAPDELVSEAMRADPDSPVLAMARHGMVPLTSRALRTSETSSRAELTLHGALSHDPRTTRLFEPNVAVPIHDHERAAQVDLVARDAMLAIEIDDWYRLRDPQAYRRDRIKDVWLQRAGFFVMRFLADDVEDRLAQTIDEIALALAGRRASGSFAENINDSHG